jgi:hypothetical protein
MQALLKHRRGSGLNDWRLPEAMSPSCGGSSRPPWQRDPVLHQLSTIEHFMNNSIKDPES